MQNLGSLNQVTDKEEKKLTKEVPMHYPFAVQIC